MNNQQEKDNSNLRILHLETTAKENSNLFVTKSANKWIEEAKNKPIPRMLFSEFWFENELCILFADTNQGKSVLAVQIADSITRGIPINGFKMDANKQAVVYFDFELSDKQFEGKYSDDYTNHYIFSDTLERVEINIDIDLPDNINYEKFLFNAFENTIKRTNARVLIVDNITYLSEETEKAKDALPLMKHLKALKKQYGLSILILAHTPKRDLSKPISTNDIQGSKMVINFIDSAFSIGKSTKDPSIKYFKQIKQRNSTQIYNDENVVVCLLKKINNNFLGFEFVEFGDEAEHLKYLSENEKAKIESQIIKLHKESPAISIRAIAKKIGVNHMKVKRILDKNKEV